MTRLKIVDSPIAKKGNEDVYQGLLRIITPQSSLVKLASLWGTDIICFDSERLVDPLRTRGGRDASPSPLLFGRSPEIDKSFQVRETT